MAENQEIYVLDKNIRLLQPENGFRTAIDAVFLAASCPAESGQAVLDMGCGVGAVGLCLKWRVPEILLHGVEIQDESSLLARKNAELNGFDAQECHFSCIDIRSYSNENYFDHVVCNPPYYEAGHHLSSPQEERALAMGHMGEDLTLGSWVQAAFLALKSGGYFCMIHRAEMLGEIIGALGKKFGAIEIIPLWPKDGVAAKRVIIRARKHRKTPAILHAGIILHEEDGRYTDFAEDILRGRRTVY